MSPILSLRAATDTDEKVLLLTDTSVFIPDVEPSNFLLEIFTPTSSKWLTYTVSKGFNIVFNGSSLKMQTARTSKHLVALPDGVYTFRMSVTPSFDTLVEFDHLRIVSLMRKWADVVGKIYSEQCSVLRREFVEKKNELLNILMDIKAAVVMVENQHDKKKGIELYEKAGKDLKKFTDECGC